MKPIPYGKQWIDNADVEAVAEVLRSDWLTQGPMVERFEEALASYCGAKYAVAVSSGTAALHLAALAVGVSGDNVVTSPITFVASANCAIYAGGRPRFVDIDPQTRNIAPTGLGQFLREQKAAAFIPVHFTGLPCEMEEIARMAGDAGVSVIEDASHALGAEYKSADGSWIKVGSCRHSDLTVFSFHPVKQITTGEGGAITTNSASLYEKLKRLRMHGITKDPEQLIQNDGPWYYEMVDLGFNYRITDFQCALGLSQLAKLDGWLIRRAEIAQRYDDAFERIDSIVTPLLDPRFKSAHHLYVVETDDRHQLYDRLKQRGILTQVHYIPVHLQPYYRDKYGYKEGDYPASEAYYRRCLSLPMYPALSDADVDRIIKAVIEETGA